MRVNCYTTIWLVTVFALSATAVSVHCGGNFTCALDEGLLYCWGEGASGQLGSASMNNVGTEPDQLPLPPLMLPSGEMISSLSLGAEHACVVFDSGNVTCWGRASEGQLCLPESEGSAGDNATNATSPLCAAFSSPATMIAAGGYHTCVLLNDSSVQCWANSTYGQTGHPPSPPGEWAQPENVSLRLPVRAVAAGLYHTCVVFEDDNVSCWGHNAYGQLGYGHSSDIGSAVGDMPPPIVELYFPVFSLSLGAYFTCALSVDGAVYCWGDNSYGQLGIGNTTNIGDDPGEMPPFPALVSSPLSPPEPVLQIAAGAYHVCALLFNGTVRCWGYGEYGQLANGQTTNILDEPLEYASDALIGSLAIYISAGFYHTCAVLESLDVVCWGMSESGQLGYGSTDPVGTTPESLPPPPVPYKSVPASTSSEETTTTTTTSATAASTMTGGMSSISTTGYFVAVTTEATTDEDPEGCEYPRPFLKAQCSGGNWVVRGSVNCTSPAIIGLNRVVIFGDFTLFGNGELSYTVRHEDVGHLDVFGTARLFGGTLSLVVLASPPSNSTFDIIYANSFIGDFTTIEVVRDYVGSQCEIVSFLRVPSPEAYSLLTNITVIDSCTSSSSVLATALGAVGGVLAAVLAVAMSYLYYRYRQKRRQQSSRGTGRSPQNVWRRGFPMPLRRM